MTHLHLVVVVVVLAVIQTKNCFPPESLLLFELRLRPGNRHQIRNEVILVSTGSTTKQDFWRPNANLEIHLNEQTHSATSHADCPLSFVSQWCFTEFAPHIFLAMSSPTD